MAKRMRPKQIRPGIFQYGDDDTNVYSSVWWRLDRFLEQHPRGESGYGIQTDIVSIDERMVVVRATIRDAEGRVIATGHAEEFRDKGYVNQTSALENCETSAIGRALGIGGYKLEGEGVCSKEELEAALNAQDRIKEEKTRALQEASAWSDVEERAFIGGLDSLGLDLMSVEELCIRIKKPVPAHMTDDQRMKLLDFLETEKGKQMLKGGNHG